MDQLLRLALRRDEIEPASGDVGVRIEAEDAVGEGVAVVMVVEEPAVEVLVAQGRLNCLKVHVVNPNSFGKKERQAGPS